MRSIIWYINYSRKHFKGHLVGDFNDEDKTKALSFPFHPYSDIFGFVAAHSA